MAAAQGSVHAEPPPCGLAVWEIAAMSIDDRLRKHLAEAKSGDGAARLSAKLAETRAMLTALHADQERIDRQVAELRARYEAECGAKN